MPSFGQRRRTVWGLLAKTLAIGALAGGIPFAYYSHRNEQERAWRAQDRAAFEAAMRRRARAGAATSRTDARLTDRLARLMINADGTDIEVVKELVRAGASVNTRARLDGTTPLMVATVHSDRAFMIELLESGADIDAQTARGGTALMDATGLPTPSGLRLLLHWGADPRIRTQDGFTAQIYAGNAGKRDFEELLSEWERRWAAYGRTGWSAR